MPTLGDPGASGPISSPGSSTATPLALRCERGAQRLHVAQMERHVLEGLGRRRPAKERDRHAVRSDGHAAVVFEFFATTEILDVPLRARARVADGETEVADVADRERCAHGDPPGRSKS
jgi:hypothetical protein